MCERPYRVKPGCRRNNPSHVPPWPYGCDGSVDVHACPRVLGHGALAGLSGWEGGAAVLAPNGAVRDRLRALAATAVVRVGDTDARVEVAIATVRLTLPSRIQVHRPRVPQF